LPVTDENLAAIEGALQAGDFSAARDLLTQWDGPTSGALLDLRGRAAYGAGDLEGCLSAYEALHRFHLDAHRSEDAAHAAVTVAMYLMMDTGLMATVRAWLERAVSLLERAPDSPIWAWVAAVGTYERFMCGDMPGAGASARRAIELGNRHGLAPPAIIGRTALGRVYVHDGRVDEGLAMLDDVALELTTGNLDPMTSGQMWCELVCAMQWVGQHDRAEQWTEAMERWRKGAAFGGLNGRCRVHRAEILRMRGPYDLAEQEALLACEELRPWMRREFGWPLTELGNVRLRKGDFAGAEDAFLAAHENAWSPQPGLALLRLAEGRVDEAWALIDDALTHPYDIPSKEHPPSGGLSRAPLLDALVPIALAVGKIEAARAATEELAQIAETYRSRTLRNAVVAARGRLTAAEGRPTEALEKLTRAMLEWVELRMPFEAATLRLEIAAAHRMAGNERSAELEQTAACRMFEGMGAPRWIDIACARLAPPPSLAAAPPKQPCEFRCVGDMRTVRFAGTEVHFKDLKGMRYLERLLLEPGREFHALDLVGVERGALPTGRSPGSEVCVQATNQGGLEVFDAEARDAYRRRLAEVAADIEAAEANNDYVRASLARADHEYLAAELARGVGLGGRARKVGEGAERARTAVTRSIRYALERIATHHPVLGEHLRRSVRTGLYFAYEPDPLSAVTWTT
jgi:tetratricopeptide (TPR) repeat protein